MNSNLALLLSMLCLKCTLENGLFCVLLFAHTLHFLGFCWQWWCSAWLMSQGLYSLELTGLALSLLTRQGPVVVAAMRHHSYQNNFRGKHIFYKWELLLLVPACGFAQRQNRALEVLEMGDASEAAARLQRG